MIIRGAVRWSSGDTLACLTPYFTYPPVTKDKIVAFDQGLWPPLPTPVINTWFLTSQALRCTAKPWIHVLWYRPYIEKQNSLEYYICSTLQGLLYLELYQLDLFTYECKAEWFMCFRASWLVQNQAIRVSPYRNKAMRLVNWCVFAHFDRFDIKLFECHCTITIFHSYVS